MRQPDYCCAILRDAADRFLLEERVRGGRPAAGEMTCFGGRREPDETPEECIRRELREELGWEPQRLGAPRLVLEVGDWLTAWFYEARLDIAPERLQVLPGSRLVLAREAELAALPLHPWHRAVLAAEARGERLVVLAERRPGLSPQS